MKTLILLDKQTNIDKMEWMDIYYGVQEDMLSMECMTAVSSYALPIWSAEAL